MKTITNYIETQLASGNFFFTKEEAIHVLQLSDNQFYQQIKRLYKKKAVYLLSHGFYVIVSAEYRNYGLLPTHWIIDAYQKHLNKVYYIALLSAASFYGATQQQPMIFQILCERPQRPLSLPRGGSLQFYMNKHINIAQITQIKTHTGYANIATKEQTVIDLVKFQKQSGYLNNVASVIRELADELSVDKLQNVVELTNETTVLQRVGFLFETFGYEALASVVENNLAKRIFYPKQLRPELTKQNGEFSKRWKIIINDEIELEE